jgi:hypothetical protein
MALASTVQQKQEGDVLMALYYDIPFPMPMYLQFIEKCTAAGRIKILHDQRIYSPAHMYRENHDSL